MKKMSSIILATMVSITFLTSCKKLNSECSSNKIGDIKLTERAENFAPLKDDEKVTFINQEGEELIFENNTLNRIGSTIATEKIGESFDLVYGDHDCYNFYQKYYLSNNMTNDENEISLRVEVTNESNVPAEIQERVNFRLYNGYNSDHEVKQVKGHYFYEDELFVDAPGHGNGIMSKIDELELNGKVFENVLSAENEYGSIYVVEHEGIVGFKVDGNTWVLK